MEVRPEEVKTVEHPPTVPPEAAGPGARVVEDITPAMTAEDANSPPAEEALAPGEAELNAEEQP